MVFFFFFFNDTATTEIYTLSLHDALPIYLARARLGKVVREADVVGLGDRTQLRAYPVAQLLHQRAGVAGGAWTAAHDVGEHRLALDVVGLADHGGLRHARMRDQQIGRASCRERV